jgi:cytochrome c oxidase accessory protein FixG
MTSSFTTWRRVAGGAQALLFLAVPFLRVGGESALRLDVPGGRLLAFGATLALGEGFVVLAAALVLTAGFLLVTLLLGRVWCGWSCPQTVLSDLTALAAPDHRRRPRRWRRPLGLLLVALVSALFSAAALGYFVEPRELVDRLAHGSLGPVLSGAWAIVATVLFLDLALVRQTFCATVCPYAKLQGVLYDRSTLVVAYDARRAADCVDCGACVRVCPTGIDIREGLQMECIACAACVDACRPIMAKLRRPLRLVGYFHGEPGGRARWLRPGSLALGAITAASIALLGATVASRAVVTLVALPEATFSARRTAEGRVVNAFSVALENHGRAPVTVALALRAGAPAEHLALRPDAVELGAGERRQLRLLATARGLPPGRTRATLDAEVRAGGAVIERRHVDVALAAPESP